MPSDDNLHNPKWTCPHCIDNPGHDGNHECPQCGLEGATDDWVTQGTDHCSQCGLVYTVSTYPDAEEQLFDAVDDITNSRGSARCLMHAVQVGDADPETFDEVVELLVDAAVRVEKARDEVVKDDADASGDGGE